MSTTMSLRRALAMATIPVLLMTGLIAGTAAAGAASGGPKPPRGFEADSASFVSASTGFVLGTRNCGLLPCKALLVKTVNGGKTWRAVPAPKIQLTQPYEASPATAVSTVRFADARHGWLFNPGLWATADGGAHWTRVKLPGLVNAIAACDGVVFAAVQQPNGSVLSARLYRSRVGSGQWTLVKGVAPANSITVFGHSAWAGMAPRLWRTTDSGAHWTKLSFRCPASYPDATGVAAASPANVALACWSGGDPQPGMSTKLVFTSSNGGRTFSKQGQPPLPGEAGMLAMPPGKPKILTLTAASGATYLYRSVNGGKAWTATAFLDAGLGVRDLSYVTGTTGYLVHFSGGPVVAYTLGLMKTVNAGKSWFRVTIP